MNNKSGFTFMEMLTVVVIIGILTGVAVPQYRRAIQRAKVTQAVAMLRTINDSANRLAGVFGYRTFTSFSSNNTDKAKATFQYMDMFSKTTFCTAGEEDCTVKAGTIDCNFSSDYKEMDCGDFTYLVNQGKQYIIAKKNKAPYKDLEIRLYHETNPPRLTCSGPNAQTAQAACDMYSIDYESYE